MPPLLGSPREPQARVCLQGQEVGVCASPTLLLCLCLQLPPAHTLRHRHTHRCIHNACAHPSWTHTGTHVYTRTHTCTCTLIMDIHTSTHTDVHTCTHTLIMDMHAHMHTHVYTCTCSTHTHTLPTHPSLASPSPFLSLLHAASLLPFG